jgi:hypothetical protein
MAQGLGRAGFEPLPEFAQNLPQNLPKNLQDSQPSSYVFLVRLQGEATPVNKEK